MSILRAAMIGDIMGDPGLEVLETRLPVIIKEHSLDFVAVNGENSSDGFGLTSASLKRILAAGADVVTSGNHIWEKREFWPILDTCGQVLRPANYPADTPGRGQVRIEKNGISWITVNLQGREFMNAIDCPFRRFDEIVKMFTVPVEQNHPPLDPEWMNGSGFFPLILVDFHAESAREKEALGYYLDGRASAVVGTHTHVQTADERILPKGTAYITDLGMTGITTGVIGMDPRICLDRVRKQVLYRMEIAKPAAGESVVAIQGVIIEIDAQTGKATGIQRI